MDNITMGTFTEEITLENILDRDFADRGYIKECEVRAVKVQAMPDTGAWTLVINEEVCRQLGLAIDGTHGSQPLHILY
jgi:predicted aspartyl protease